MREGFAAIARNGVRNARLPGNRARGVSRGRGFSPGQGSRAHGNGRRPRPREVGDRRARPERRARADVPADPPAVSPRGQSSRHHGDLWRGVGPSGRPGRARQLERARRPGSAARGGAPGTLTRGSGPPPVPGARRLTQRGRPPPGRCVRVVPGARERGAREPPRGGAAGLSPTSPGGAGGSAPIRGGRDGQTPAASTTAPHRRPFFSPRAPTARDSTPRPHGEGRGRVRRWSDRRDRRSYRARIRGPPARGRCRDPRAGLRGGGRGPSLGEGGGGGVRRVRGRGRRGRLRHGRAGPGRRREADGGEPGPPRPRGPRHIPGPPPTPRATNPAPPRRPGRAPRAPCG